MKRLKSLDGIAIGDMVKIIGKDKYFNNDGLMDHCIGKIYKVIEIRKNMGYFCEVPGGFRISNSQVAGWWFLPSSVMAVAECNMQLQFAFMYDDKKCYDISF